MDGIYVVGGNSGPEGAASIVFFMHFKKIVVSFFPSNKLSGDDRNVDSEEGKSCLEDFLIQQISAPLSEDFDDDDEPLESVLETVLEVGKSVFAEVGPFKQTIRQSSEKNLHNLLFPPTFYYRLLTTGGSPTIIPIGANESYTIHTPNFDHYEDEELEIDEDLPQYSTDQISVEEVLLTGKSYLIGRILVDNKDMLCKVWATDYFQRKLEQETSRLYRIRKASLQGHTLMHIPPLLGYVKHPEADCVIGLLREWILGTPLRKIDIPATPESKRQKWASQISRAVHQLHEIEVVWGDGKPHNIIIDEKDDAWLIDFGGGWTNGWVPEELADTAEGDQHAFKKIVEYLQCSV